MARMAFVQKVYPGHGELSPPIDTDLIVKGKIARAWIVKAFSRETSRVLTEVANCGGGSTTSSGFFAHETVVIWQCEVEDAGIPAVETEKQKELTGAY